MAEKADSNYPSGRQQFQSRYGKREGHHRDRRPGHVHRGATHELGRVYCLLARIAGEEGDAGITRTRHAGRASTGGMRPQRGNTNKNEASKVPGGSESEPSGMDKGGLSGT